MKDIAIVGSGGLGKEIAVLLHQINQHELSWNVIGFYDDGNTAVQKVAEYLVLGKVDDLNNVDYPLHVVVAIGDPAIKKSVVERIKNTRIKFPVLIHPSATIGLNVRMGEGSVITAGCRLTVDIKIKKHVLLNLNTTVGHDVVVGDFCSVMPGVHLSGHVSIGESVLIGTGTSILQKTEVGDGAIIGAGAVVNKSVKAGITVAGVPARSIFKK